MQTVFWGDGSLLIRCVEHLLKRGGDCVGIVSSDPRVRDWASSHGIADLGTSARPEFGDIHPDWLFSVGNLTPVPVDLIDRARRGAVNFHDGPLPAFAGLNVPIWALLAGATEHAITWHEMTEVVDAGRILVERRFPIEAGETAVSLNVKCAEAGFAGFTELLDGITQGTLVPRSAVGERRLFLRSDRPATLGVIDPQSDRDSVERLVRALDVGAYENPMAVAKLWTGRQLIRVGQAERIEGSADAGTVLAVSEGAVDLAASDGAVRVSGLTTLDGRPMSGHGIGLRVGERLPVCPSLEQSETRAIGRAEPAWRAEIARLQPAVPPFPLRDGADGAFIRLPLEVAGLVPDQLGAAFLLWLARLSGQDEASCGVLVPATHPGLSPLRPMTVDAPRDRVASVAVDAAREAIGGARSRAGMAADLILRSGDPAVIDRAFAALSVAIAADVTDEALAEAGVRLALIEAKKELAFDTGATSTAVAKAMAEAFQHFLDNLVDAGPDARLGEVSLTATLDLVGPVADVRAGTIHAALRAQAMSDPGWPALEAGDVRLTRGELDAKADRLAAALAARGAGPGQVVGVCLERSADLVVTLLAVLKTGAAYLPLDPAYPQERIRFMAEDSQAALFVTTPAIAARQGLDPALVVSPSDAGEGQVEAGRADDLAYLIYTSGSTGRPKGVMISHRNVMNFLTGMDTVVPISPDSRLLSVTSMSFDIFVLELFWTLSRGATVVLQTDRATGAALPGFSLFYFASEAAGTGHHAYRLLIEGATFADANGFEAIWTPERHFHAFGGLYPNPAISSAMVAGMTKNVKVRAGSSVVPLHHPIRVAEDWALVDNLSNGRAGIAIASGWQPNDFVIRPYAFETRKETMVETIDTLRKLWRGEDMSFPNHRGEPVAVEIHPKPMQAELPLWITAAGNPETFVIAAEKGCGVLTHLLGQTFEEVAEKIALYRATWAKQGHKGRGTVTLMLHTFIGDSEAAVRETVHGPMKGYLKSAVDLVKRASWSFPTIVERAVAKGVSPAEMLEREPLTEAELDAVLEHAFDRYYKSSGLFGTVETAGETLRKVIEIGVDEVACLIDFGVDTDVALANLPNIKRLRDGLAAEGGVGRRATVADDILERAVTHLQCTPSMASMLVADGAGRAALGRLQAMLVGGEALSSDLARDLRAAVPGVLLNMYGPTETTVWSSVARLDTVDKAVPLGAPIANTTLSVRAPDGSVLPPLAAGELWIGGEGVARGYWQRADLTAERFVDTPNGRFYRTGDLVRRGLSDEMSFLGRIDHQVKIRGHRIELGECEAALSGLPGIRQAVVSAVTFGAGDIRLVGYVTAQAGARVEPEALRSELALRLPEVLVPSVILVLDAFPMTPNRKVDRKALPHPAELRLTEAAPEMPAEGELESTIAAIWAEALGLPGVSVERSFFDLGGHSLLVVQVQRRMKDRLGRDIALTDFFRFPTVRSLARHLGGGEDASALDAAGRGAARAAARLARRGARA